MQEKSVEARQRNKFIREELAKQIWAELESNPRKLRAIAKGIVDRSANSSSDLLAMADIMDGKQKESVSIDTPTKFVVTRKRNADSD